MESVFFPNFSIYSQVIYRRNKMKNKLLLGVAVGAVATGYLVYKNQIAERGEKKLLRKIENLFK